MDFLEELIKDILSMEKSIVYIKEEQFLTEKEIEQLEQYLKSHKEIVSYIKEGSVDFSTDPEGKEL